MFKNILGKVGILGEADIERSEAARRGKLLPTVFYTHMKDRWKHILYIVFHIYLVWLFICH